jgi:hypothetical protein
VSNGRIKDPISQLRVGVFILLDKLFIIQRAGLTIWPKPKYPIYNIPFKENCDRMKEEEMKKTIFCLVVVLMMTGLLVSLACGAENVLNPKEYKIVCSDSSMSFSNSISGLTEQVNSQIKNGWVPIGGAVSMAGGLGKICQALVRY